MTARELRARLNDRKTDLLLASLYGKDDANREKKRLDRLLQRLAKAHPDKEAVVMRAPGRTELGGNHTDHNHGRVLAAAVSLDILAAAVKTHDQRVTLASPAYPRPLVINLTDTRKNKSEAHTTAGLVRGVAHYLGIQGKAHAGFYAEIDSTVPSGAGLSSSAAFEVLVGGIWNELDHLEKTTVELAIIGQKAENAYYGKPCGLMDQLASACGGVVAIDFNDPSQPLIEKVVFDPEDFGFTLFIIDTGGSHANLTRAYSAIPAEMRSVAAFFGRKDLRRTEINRVLKNIPVLRKKSGDRSILRALHFFQENERVARQTAALKKKHIREFLSLVKASRDSSWEQLQNCQPPESPRRQGIALGLALSDAFLQDADTSRVHGGSHLHNASCHMGAARVHGGGFEGTIQCYVPLEAAKKYQVFMEDVFGKGSVIRVRMCPHGLMKIL